MRKTVVRNSKIQGRGLYALVDFNFSETVIDYTGPILTEDEAIRLDAKRKHCVFMALDDNRIIDGVRTRARFVNHSCSPNVRTITVGDINVFVAKRKILAGEEILLDYRLDTGSERKLFRCRCRSEKCRGYMNDPASLRKWGVKNG